MKKQIFKLMLLCAALLYIGCGEDDEITNPPPSTDTSLANFNDLVISERTLPFDAAFSAVDLYHGVILLDSSSVKDANLIDNLPSDSTFWFRSGHLSDMPAPGYQTRFKLVYQTLTQQEFDTIKVIPDSDSALTEDDFGLDQTDPFRIPLQNNTVWGFYLKGRYDLNVTPFRVFGLIYLDFSYTDPIPKLRFDVKINKAGNNSFKSIIVE